ncbi:RipA family octameric membrane protein [Pseudomonas aeruginosa]|uniref:RipA family octameric membrane protein n=1 Tax=Pseudomonas aeruginosa TaxID=287 RepID=UPI000F62BAD3|nr:hypothetical protein [Pseudomonas aeruginosa]MBV5706266.1 hypothetical protein [Pseudomonas aeruginosa]MBV5932198.1 hypothetical protein [Pseudomonas aeruginosa]MCK1841229.1 hypothetical protein [Pseudomonas aeruginosa]HCF1770727.1 hypothetical protein [Pseudomonas aeruginosa]HCL3284717.1 hypothetical protein [Pseudomonas aeruginosa]
MNDKDRIDRSIEHAWKYFELHAQQRMTVFNFFLAIAGLVAAGIGVGLQQGSQFSILVSLLGFFLVFVSFIFWKLDQRVSSMIKLAEAALCHLEGLGVTDEASIFSKEYKEANGKCGKSIWTYGECFRLSFLVAGLIGALFIVVPHII